METKFQVQDLDLESKWIKKMPTVSEMLCKKTPVELERIDSKNILPFIALARFITSRYFLIYHNKVPHFPSNFLFSQLPTY